MPYFTIFKNFLCPSFDISLKEREKLDKFLEILEESGVGKIINEELPKHGSQGGRPSYDSYRLFATILYGFSKHSGSVRKIEESINYDLRFIYLMEQKRPTYVTISKFLNNVVVKRQREIFTKIVQTILTKYDISKEDVFIDGTKLEANANKYKFVWKPITAHKKLQIKVRETISKYYDLPESKQTFLAKEIGEYIDGILKKVEAKGLTTITTRGRATDPLVKDYKLLCTYLIRMLDYEEQERICGNGRNSYYKTDKDATAMCLKEDYYSGLGSNMHAGYNLQIAVSKGMILDYYVNQERNDVRTFVPFLEQIREDYGENPKRICADSGYGILQGYRYLKENDIENYVKYPMWNAETQGKEINLYRFNEKEEFECINGKIGKEYTGRHVKQQGYKLYKVEGCLRCKYKEYCMRALKHPSKSERIFEASYEWTVYRDEARDNLLSPKGIEMRVNRSSQVEGAFGVIKQDMEYERVRRRGIENVSAEVMMVCLGYNIRKLFSLIEGTSKMDYWKAPKDLTCQEIPKINIEKLLNKNQKKLSKNQATKKEYKYK